MNKYTELQISITLITFKKYEFKVQQWYSYRENIYETEKNLTNSDNCGVLVFVCVKYEICAQLKIIQQSFYFMLIYYQKICTSQLLTILINLLQFVK